MLLTIAHCGITCAGFLPGTPSGWSAPSTYRTRPRAADSARTPALVMALHSLYRSERFPQILAFAWETLETSSIPGAQLDMQRSQSLYLAARITALDLEVEGNLKAAHAHSIIAQDLEEDWLQTVEWYLEVAGDEKGLSHVRAERASDWVRHRPVPAGTRNRLEDDYLAKSGAMGAAPPSWDAMTVKELKEHLRRRKLKVGGKKAELVERLESNPDRYTAVYAAGTRQAPVTQTASESSADLRTAMSDVESEYCRLRLVALDLAVEGNLEAAKAMAPQLEDAEQRWLKEQLRHRLLKVSGKKAELVEELESCSVVYGAGAWQAAATTQTASEWFPRFWEAGLRKEESASKTAMINTESDYAWLRVVALELMAEGNLKAADAMAQQVKDAEQRWLDSFERWLQVTGDKKGLARMRARNTAPEAWRKHVFGAETYAPFCPWSLMSFHAHRRQRWMGTVYVFDDPFAVLRGWASLSATGESRQQCHASLYAELGERADMRHKT